MVGEYLFSPETEEVTEAVNEAEALEGELVEIPELGEVLVSGDPFATGEKLDDDQGDNPLNAKGDCGVVSVVNMVRMAGGECTEEEAIVKAVSQHLCAFSTDYEDSQNGGTNVFHRQALLEQYGISSTPFPAEMMGPDRIAALSESGYLVNITTNAGIEWGDANMVEDGKANHSIVVTGTARDPETHELLGVFVCDSGLPGESSANFLSVDVLNDAYTNTEGATALISNEPIRKV